MSDKDEAFEKLDNLAREFTKLDGQDIHSAVFPLRSVISETPDEAKKREEYEEFLKTSQAAEKNLEDFASQFIMDMIYKHLKI